MSPPMNRKQRRLAAKRAAVRQPAAPAGAAPPRAPAGLPGGGGVASVLMGHATGGPPATAAADNPEAALQMAVGYLQENRFDLASQHLQELVARHPGDPRALQLLGVVNFELGNPERAVDLLRHAVRLAPDYTEAQHNLGLVLFSLEQYESAAAALRKAVALAPKDAAIWLNLGNAVRALGQFDAAAEAYDKAVELAPDNAMAALNRANLIMERNQLEAALTLFDELIARYPDLAEAHNSRGACLASLHRAEESAASHARAAELAPDNEEYRINVREAWSRLIPAWHLPMLADEARNAAYRRTLDKHVREGMHVLDIGAGSGLLAMMAARAGAAKVTAVEMNRALADVARQIIADNGFAERIQVVNSVSMDLKVGVDLPAADLVVSEVLDAGLLGEGVLPTLRHASRDLLKPQGRMVPAGATVYGQLVELPALRTVNPVAEIAGFDLSAFDRFRNPATHRRITLARENHKALSEPFLIAEFDFAAPPMTARWRQVTVPITATGEAYAVVFWFDLHLDEAITVSSGPDGSLSHWDQAVQFMDQSRMVAAGDILPLNMGHTDTRFYFSL